MRGVKKIVFAITTTAFLSLVYFNQAVFADYELEISVSSNNVNLAVTPEVFTSSSQTLTVSTTSLAGYTVKLAPTGSSNALIHQTNSELTIPTFTLPAGSESLPAGSTGYGYGFSIDNGLNYYPIPAPNTNQPIFSTSEPGENEHTLTFGALTAMSYPSGSYSNTITIQATANLTICPANNICYYGNDDDGTGTMSNQEVSSNSDVVLIPPNYSRSGYGFASWNTNIDGTGTNYGPNATISVGDLSVQGLQLYAKWVESEGNMQGWEGCRNLSVGDVTALTDIRDGQTYAVAKHPDNQCWMMENLRLDLSDSDVEISGLNTNRPSTNFARTVSDDHPAPNGNFCSEGNANCINRINYNIDNTNRSLNASYTSTNSPSSWYAYGAYYNWFTATAGNGTYEQDIAGSSSDGDLCPANWRLPASADEVGDYATLDRSYGGTGRDQTSGNSGILASERWRAYPMNFVYSGEQRGNAAVNRGVSSSLATLNTQNNERTVNIWLRAEGISLNSNTTYKYRGQTMRCLFNEGYKVRGNVHYDANGGTGTMADNIDVILGTALADYNQFTKPYSSFVTWNSSPEGNGVVIKEGGMVAGAADYMGITEGETLTLYAIWRSEYSLAYDGNGADAGSMANAGSSSLSTGKLSLVASNYSKTGYSFGGWSTDPNAATKLANEESVTIYGPNETINVDNSFLETNCDPVTHEVRFYAVWIPEDSTYTMQTFNSTACSNLAPNRLIALKDIRDNNIYTVTKLGDGNCWMTENLRLDPSNVTFTNDNTNSPTSRFIGLAETSSTNNTLCKTDDTDCVDTVRYNTNAINRNLSASHNANGVNYSWYSYGVMYGWYTATAGNGMFDTTSTNAAGDICPKNWRLPTGGSNGEYNALNRAINHNLTNTDAGIVSFPANFVYSGDFNYNTPGGRNQYARLWSSTPLGSEKAYRMGATSNASSPTGSWNKWDAFAVRCMIKPQN